ncbi:hypothetical protein BDW02DRAFT_567556 [Decorospora gaudefroyi]|uniref:Uncharacterized protein n=1 Tax=Decorospora gaudefroyi TaxID=184978 RepID=A0A6A5KQM7_9PLEO|nr:hypothetical protein BDW02DRAFT_567556 [Decorospora gaudefroyi]
MSHSWLQRKRKAELIDLAQKARLPDADGLLKDDLVEMLSDHLNSHETTLAKLADFRDYYGRNGSPIKRERSSPSEALSVSKPTRRRTLIKEPSPEPSPVSEPIRALARTPRAIPRRVSSALSEVDMPASPAQLAEVADQSFRVVAGKATELWHKTQIDHFKEVVRENASSVATIQTLILLLEAAGLQYNTLDTTPLFHMPEMLATYSDYQDVHGPNGWALLTAEWWAPAVLWSLTSWVLPLMVSYFFNLTIRSNTERRSADRQYPADPLIFNVVRAVLAYSAYRGTTDDTIVPRAWGPFSEYAVLRVAGNVPGGYYGLQIGSLVGVLVSLYDAALKK